MSRLDSFIRRLEAQRACLNQAARLIADLPGIVLELGLGNGRTYDHLRELLPERDIYVFDRQVNAHPACVPPQDRLFLGDIFETFPQAFARLGRSAAMAHLDLGSGNEEASRAQTRAFLPVLQPLLKAGAVVLSDQEITVSGFELLPLPEGVKPGRYYLSRAR